MGAASRITVAVTGAVTTVFIARVLGADGAGAFSIALTIIYVLTVFTTLGVEHGVAYYVSGGRWPAADAFRTSLRFAMRIGVAGAVAGVLARLVVPDALRGATGARSAGAPPP